MCARSDNTADENIPQTSCTGNQPNGNTCISMLDGYELCKKYQEVKEPDQLNLGK